MHKLYSQGYVGDSTESDGRGIFPKFLDILARSHARLVQRLHWETAVHEPRRVKPRARSRTKSTGLCSSEKQWLKYLKFAWQRFPRPGLAADFFLVPDEILQSFFEEKRFQDRGCEIRRFPSYLELLQVELGKDRIQNFPYNVSGDRQQILKILRASKNPNGANSELIDEVRYSDFNGKYVGLSSHRGTIAISYVPFKGAKEMGSVDGNLMELKVDKKFKIRLKSETDFLPAGVTAKVYAIYKPEKKSRGVGSLHSWDTSNESRIQEALK